MSQLGFWNQFFESGEYRTRRAEFFAVMEKTIPWSAIEDLIRPYYPTGRNGRPPKPLRTMLRIYFVQQWFGLSDPAAEEEIYESISIQRFVGIDIGHHAVPDETTILNFRHLLEQHNLTERLLEVVNRHLEEKGVLLRRGTIVDATIISAPPSTKNRDQKRDPEMRSTKKGNNYYFGMKAHVGVDKDSGLVHRLVTGSAEEHDSQRMDELLHGEEREIYGDKAYDNAAKREAFRAAGGRWRVAKKATRGTPLTSQQERWNKSRNRVRSKVEHVFGVVKNLWGYRMVRYRGIYKNHCQLCTLMALANLYLARRTLLKLQQASA